MKHMAAMINKRKLWLRNVVAALFFFVFFFFFCIVGTLTNMTKCMFVYVSITMNKTQGSGSYE